MRNLLEYPITDQEIVECLYNLASKLDAEERIGDMRAVLLTTAGDIVAARKITEAKLKAAQEHMAVCAGDTISLENEVRLMRRHLEDAQALNVKYIAAVDAAAECLIDSRTAENPNADQVHYLAGGHRRLRLADALKALKDG